MILLGGETAWKVRRVGPMVLAYHWHNGKPAMFVYPESRQTGYGALCIPLESAHLWAKSDGYPNLDHAIPTAMKAAPTMGVAVSKPGVKMIVDAVMEGIEDLVKMPPERPQPKGETIGELTVMDGGRVTSEREITADEMA
jgi:hypothetical protein